MSNLQWEPPDALTPLSCDKILWKETSARCGALGVTCGEIFLHVQNCAGVFFFVLYALVRNSPPPQELQYDGNLFPQCSRIVVVPCFLS